MTVGAAAALTAGATAAGLPEESPIPLKASTSYRDWCDGFKPGKGYPCPRGAVPQRLWRPLALPTLAPGQSCPVSTPHTVTRNIAPVLGSGPVYFAAGAPNPADRSTTTMPFPVNEVHIAWGTGWSAAKTPIVMKKAFRQPLLLRGARIDAPGELGFTGNVGRRPIAAMQFPATGYKIPLGSYKAHSLNIWATAPGCYALQIDGTSFTTVVTFRVAFTATGR